MKQGYTHISIILDRSGSMAAIRDDTLGDSTPSCTTRRHSPELPH